MNGKVLFIVGETISEQNKPVTPKADGDMKIYRRLGKLGYLVKVTALRTFINEDTQQIEEEMIKFVKKLLNDKKPVVKSGGEDGKIFTNKIAKFYGQVKEERMHGLLGEIEIVLLSSTILSAPRQQTESAVAPDESEEQRKIEVREITEQVREHFCNRLIPVVVLDAHLLAPLDMATEKDTIAPLEITAEKDRVAPPDALQQIKIVKRESDRVGGLTGEQKITKAQLPYGVRNLPRTAVIIATMDDNTEDGEETDSEGSEAGASADNKNLRAFFYGYRSGTVMKYGKIAPARRIALLFTEEVAAQATPIGWEIFDRTIELAGKAGAINDVFQAEWAEIRERRRRYHGAEKDLDHPPENLVGLALSGGGIRSATFSLGLLQGFKESGVLKVFDYLSTVSGGGYVGGWWSAWLARDKNRRKGIFPGGEKIEVKRVSDYLKSKDKLNEGSLCADTDPIHHLRLFSNYLTPRKGLLSSDTWQAITMMIRNIFLTWVVLLPILFSFVLVGQFYFVLQKDSRKEFLVPFQENMRKAEAEAEVKHKETLEYYEKQRNAESQFRNHQFIQLSKEEEKPEQTTTPAMQLAASSQKGNDPTIANYERRQALIVQESEKRLMDLEIAKEQDLQTVAEPLKSLRGEYGNALNKRLKQALLLLLPIVGLLLVTTVFWMRVGITPNPMEKLAHTVPGLIFWLLVICVICLMTSVNFGDWRKYYDLSWQNLKAIPWWKYFAVAIAWLVGTVFLLCRSLPIKKKENREDSQSYYAMILSFFRDQQQRKMFLRKSKKQWEEVFKENKSGKLLSALLIFLMLGLLIAVLTGLKKGVSKEGEEYIFWLVLAGVLLCIGVWAYSQPQNEDQWEWRKLIHGNKLQSIQSMLMVTMVGAAFVLALSGYGYEIANYLLRDPKAQKGFVDYIAKAGGWAAIILSIGGSIFTAVKSSPSGGEDKGATSSAGFKTRLMFTLTPVLVLICLAVAFAWLARWMLIQFAVTPEPFIAKLNKAVLLSVSLYLFLAVYEIRNWTKVWRVLWRVGLLAGIAALIYFVTTGFQLSSDRVRDADSPIWVFNRSPGDIDSQSPRWLSFCAVLGFGAIFTGASIVKRYYQSLKKWLFATLCMGTLYAALFGYLAFWGKDRAITVSIEQSAAILTGIICCGIVMIFEYGDWDGQTKRTLHLITFTYLVLICFLFFTFFVNSVKHQSITLAYLALGLLFLAISWSVAIGWMTDPNLLSMHTFYKARLVRAYLGASNPNRKAEQKEITEAVGGDDVLLREMKNCQRGAPYHLINTTLNLVGGKDLVTAQRSSDNFTFSKLYSGSSRTGYRRNLQEQYMQGQMSLGTAVAISGAAVSPNMGAKTQTSAVAMLLTLLNVRLGYWASTPNRNLWRSAQASLWPFYMLKEFSSQTNDLSGYCYLTDGGHFDNTGLYSLVERGCRFIILADNGVDTKPCFEDLGDAIRRCRIDFQAEISLDVSPFFKETDKISEDKLARSHYIVGAIEYAEEHLKHIGWREVDAQDAEKRRGLVILIKPSLVKEDSADIRQYARQNSGFPQQSTGDFWFDEAQFESYRQIGKISAQKVLVELGLSTALKISPADPLTPQKVESTFNIAWKRYAEKIQIEERKTS